MKLSFGEAYTIQIKSEQGKGTGSYYCISQRYRREKAMSHSKRGAQAIAIGMICVLLGVISFEIDSGVAEQEANEKAVTSWEKAERSPLIPYPETVTYTLAKNDGFRQFRYAGWRYL
mgnify:CR=1 FL=1